MKKTVNFNNITPFSRRKKTQAYNPKKCFKYYYSKTKHNISASIQITLYYIQEYYNHKRCDKNMQKIEQNKIENKLLYRYEEVNKKYKYSYSNWSSIIVSFIVSLYFIILQTYTEDGLSVFEMIILLIKFCISNINESPTQTVITLIPLFLFVFAIILIVLLSVVFFAQAPVDLLYYSKYRNFIIPFERATIIETLKTYNDNYSTLE